MLLHIDVLCDSMQLFHGKHDLNFDYFMYSCFFIFRLKKQIFRSEYDVHHINNINLIKLVYFIWIYIFARNLAKKLSYKRVTNLYLMTLYNCLMKCLRELAMFIVVFIFPSSNL